GGETLPRFHTADGYPARTNAACGTFEGSAGVRAAAAAEIQHPTSSIAADRCARGLRGSRFAQAGGAESGAERRGSHAQRRTIAAGAEPARGNGGNYRGRYRKGHSTGKPAENIPIVFHHASGG